MNIDQSSVNVVRLCVFTRHPRELRCFPFVKSAHHAMPFFPLFFVIEEIFVHLSFASFSLWLKPVYQHAGISIDACISAMAAMAGLHGHYYEDDRMIRRSIDSHGWKKGDVESGSNDNSWDFDFA